ncbi:MAG: T9SS type A sorting domain-containing protein [Ferruginibacter sp.]
MKLIKLPALFCALLSILSSYGQNPATYTSTLRPNTRINPIINGFHESLPQGYYDNPNEKFPVLLVLSGNSERGDGTTAEIVDRVTFNRPVRLIRYGEWPGSFTVNGQVFKFIVITPQFYQNVGLNVSDVEDCRNYILNNYKVDADRFYLTGNSVGGGLDWIYCGSSVGNANKIAATVITAGSTSPNTGLCSNMAQSKLPVLAAHYEGDPVVPYSWSSGFVNTINSLLVQPATSAKLITYIQPPPPNNIQHDATWNTFDLNLNAGGAYNNQLVNKLNVYEWMLQYRRFLTTLPVTLTDFNVVKQGVKAVATWTTSSEINNRGFEIFRSADGRLWQSIGFINSSSINGNGASYSFTDNSPLPAKNYYRIRQVDNNNTEKVSEIKYVDFSKKGFASIYPNPANAVLNINTDYKLNKAPVKIYNVQGQAVKQGSLTGTGTISFAIESLLAGSYVMELVYEGEIIRIKFIKK